MDAEQPNGIDRAAIAAHAQRTAEQVALRRVRKALDDIEEDRRAERRTVRRVLIVCAILALLGAAYIAWMVFSAREAAKQAPVQLPAAQRQK